MNPCYSRLREYANYVNNSEMCPISILAIIVTPGKSGLRPKVLIVDRYQGEKPATTEKIKRYASRY